MSETHGGVRSYARHRGCTHSAVQRAMSTGRLQASVTRVGGKVVIDFASADLEWRNNTSGIPRSPVRAQGPETQEPVSVMVHLGAVVLAWIPDGPGAADRDAWQLLSLSTQTARLLGQRLLELANDAESAPERSDFLRERVTGASEH